MLTLFSGPPQDMGINDALRNIQNSPTLVIDLEGQRKRYATGLLDTLEKHSDCIIPWTTPTVVIFGGVRRDILETLYPPESPKPRSQSDWTNDPTKKRNPYFS